MSGFVGRSGELAQLADLLDSARLVTVAGPGGVGKTRLALRAAAERGPCADGSCLVELSGLTDPELLPDTVALRLGLRRAPTRPTRLEAVLDELRGRKLLLILDTCEHLTAACAEFVATVLRETSDIRILATSRQPLHVPGEEVLRLGPLPVPGTETAATVSAAGDAVELFAQRAAAAVSGFRLTEPDLPDVIRLCRRLDGIPLAIELAAVRVRALPIAELAGADRDGARRGGIGTRRGSISRHQTLHAAIDWSYGLCTGAEKAAWRRLSVFAGTFDMAVAQGRDRRRGGEVDLPPSRPTRCSAGWWTSPWCCPAGAGRYRLLDSVREYGAARLADAGEDTECHERHLAHYLSLTRDFSHRLVADGQRDRLGRLRAEHANIRGALEYGLTGRLPSAGGSQRRRRARGPPRGAGRRPAGRRAVPLLGHVRLDPRGHALAGQGARPVRRAVAGAGQRAGQPGAARHRRRRRRGGAQANEAIAMAARLGDDRTHARAYLALQFALTTAGRYQEALEAAKQARWRLEALGAEHALRTLDMQLALTYVHARNFDAAIEHASACCAASPRRAVAARQRARPVGARALPAARAAAECATAATAALRATQRDQQPGRRGLLARGARLAGRGRGAVPARRLAARRRAGTVGAHGRRPAQRQHRARRLPSAVPPPLAASTLGTARYAELHAAGAARPLAQIVALAVAGADVLPELPGLRASRSRPATGRAAKSSPRASARSRCSSRAGCPTRTSRTGSSSPSGRWTRTSITSSPSSGFPRGCS